MTIVKLADREVKRVVTELNKVLDDNNIIGAEFNKQVILELILQNLSKTQSIDLIKRIEETPISQWND